MGIFRRKTKATVKYTAGEAGQNRANSAGEAEQNRANSTRNAEPDTERILTKEKDEPDTEHILRKAKDEPDTERILTKEKDELTDMPEAFRHLAGILEAEALELCPGSGDESGCILIPYMMNDALEYVLVLHGANITGEYNKDLRIGEAQMLTCDPVPDSTPLRYALALTYEDRSRCTVFFDYITERVHAYRCHEIGHFWVPGQEQWRQLVYILGTLHDKYDYFGERFCTPEEQELMWLVEFAPLREWSPVGESIAGRYPESRQGTEAMLRLAEEAGDEEYAKQLRRYRRFPRRKLAEELQDLLQQPARWRLYDRIWQKLAASQEVYGSRDYGDAENQRIARMRREIDRRLREQGFEGEYPLYRGTKKIGKEILKDLGGSADEAKNQAETLYAATDEAKNQAETLYAAVDGMRSSVSACTASDPADNNISAADRPDIGKCVLVTVTEEHPFTELERPDYHFNLQIMMSEGPTELLAPLEEASRWNLGFFDDPKLHSRILRP